MPPAKLITAIVVWGWLLVGAAPDAFAARPAKVEVRIFQAHTAAAYYQISGPAQMISPRPRDLPAGSYRISTTAGGLRLVPLTGKDSGKALLTGRQLVLSGVGGIPLSISHSAAGQRRYRGLVCFTTADQKTVEARNIVDARDYIIAVLGSETLPQWCSEALKAQAVLTQSRLSRYKRGDLLDDTTQAEAYLGADHERPEARQALTEVWGQVLTYKGLPIETFYHSTCAGGTSDGGELFKGEHGVVPYATAVRCEFCRPSPFWKTTVTAVPAKQFARLHTHGLPRVFLLDTAKRPILLQDAVGGAPYNAYNFWIRIGQNLGWDKVPGTRFCMTRTADGMVEFRSTGAGHGVGMCQWGANEQARQGRTYKDILKYYFPLCELRQVD